MVIQWTQLAFFIKMCVRTTVRYMFQMRKVYHQKKKNAKERSGWLFLKHLFLIKYFVFAISKAT